MIIEGQILQELKYLASALRVAYKHILKNKILQLLWFEWIGKRKVQAETQQASTKSTVNY